MCKERFVCVEWDDAASNSGYYDSNDEKRFNPVPAQTVGHLIKKDRHKILIAGERFFHSDGEVDERHIFTIPRKMVKRIRYLEDTQ